jgi:hypothetical protein
MIVSLLISIVVLFFIDSNTKIGDIVYLFVFGFASTFPGSAVIAAFYYLVNIWISKRKYVFWNTMPGAAILDVLIFIIIAIVLYIIFIHDTVEGISYLEGGGLYYLIFSVASMIIWRIGFSRKLKY